MSTNFTEEEQQQLIQAFEALGTKPKMDNPDDLREWMSGFVRAQEGDIKPEVSELKQQNRSHSSTNHYVHPSAIALFYGDSDQKGVAFDTWKYEVLTRRKEGVHANQVITTAAKKSLRGQAAQISQRLGVNATVEQILDKFEGIYGTVEDTEDLMTLFYSAHQKVDENVATWGCRLEDLLYRAKKEQYLSEEATRCMLLSKFNNGLHDVTKDRIRHLAGKIKDFDELRVAARKVEAEIADQHVEVDAKSKSEFSKPKKAQVKMAKATDGSSDEVDWPKLICSLQSRLDMLEQKSQQNKPIFKQRQKTHFQPPSRRGKYQQNGSQMKPSMTQQRSSSYVPTCYRCGQLGHLKVGCRAILPPDEQLAGNDMESATRGQR